MKCWRVIEPKLRDSEEIRNAKRLRTCLPQAGKKFAKNAGTPRGFCE